MTAATSLLVRTNIDNQVRHDAQLPLPAQATLHIDMLARILQVFQQPPNDVERQVLLSLLLPLIERKVPIWREDPADQTASIEDVLPCAEQLEGCSVVAMGDVFDAKELPQIVDTLVRAYVKAGYLDVDNGNTIRLFRIPASASPLEKAIASDNAAAACALIDLGADIARIPVNQIIGTSGGSAGPKGSNVIIEPGDFTGYMQHMQDYYGSVVAEVRAALMRRIINEVSSKELEVMAPTSEPSSSALRSRRISL